MPHQLHYDRDWATKCKMARTVDPFFIFNNVNNFEKLKIGEQFLIKKPMFGDNSHIILWYINKLLCLAFLQMD